MKRQELLARLVRGVQADIQDYERLHALLEDQFQAALHHRTAQLPDLSEAISDVVEDLDQRRHERVAVARSLIGSGLPVTIPHLMRSLPDSVHTALQPHWRELERLVRDCKTLNTRNCQLMVEQHALMHRVLHGEEGLYAAV